MAIAGVGGLTLPEPVVDCVRTGSIPLRSHEEESVATMLRVSKLALFGLVIGAVAGSSSTARAQGMSVDAKRGKLLWEKKSCDACHSIGHGLKKWLKNDRRDAGERFRGAAADR